LRESNTLRPEVVGSELLATLSNAALKLDPLTEPRLTELEGHSVRFEITLPGRPEPLPLTLSVKKACLQFAIEAESRVNAVVRGSAAELFVWLQGGQSHSLSFDGDEQLLARLAGLLSGFQPDLARPLNRILGEEATANLLGLAETALAATRSALQAAGSAAADQTRARFTDQPSMNQAMTQAEELTLKVDRLLARVSLLEESGTRGVS